METQKIVHLPNESANRNLQQENGIYLMTKIMDNMAMIQQLK